MKIAKALLLATSFAVLSLCCSCGSTGARGQTQTPPTILIPDTGCQTENGCIPFVDPGYFIVMRIGPQQTTTKPSILTYTLTQDFHLKRLEAWIGTSFGSEGEFGSFFQYQKPDGHKAEFQIEFDKHIDGNHGEKQINREFATPILLPAGTIITVYSGGVNLPAQGCPGCGEDQTWMMYSE